MVAEFDNHGETVDEVRVLVQIIEGGIRLWYCEVCATVSPVAGECPCPCCFNPAEVRDELTAAELLASLAQDDRKRMN